MCVLKIADHDKFLFLGNGQKALTVQLSEVKSKVSEIEADIKGTGAATMKKDDAHLAGVQQERLKLISTVVGVVGAILMSAFSLFHSFMP
jgi:hypothetical protein